MSVYLLTTDLHLTDKAQDAYRFDLFPWLARTCLKRQVTDLCILGDLTDAKDRHPASLVQKVVDALQLLVENCGARVHILKGNHDYAVDATNPFFQFLKHMPGIHYYTFPSFVNEEVLFLPNTRDPAKDWAKLDLQDVKYRYIFLHQGFLGAKTSQGFALTTGIDATKVLGAHNDWLFSGDIHVPQECGPVTYVGTPYPIHFDDTYQCRVLLLRPDKAPLSIPYHSIKKQTLVIYHADELFSDPDVIPGAHVKIRLMIPESEIADRLARRTAVLLAAEQHGLIVHALEVKIEKSETADETPQRKTLSLPSSASPDQVVATFVKRERLSPTLGKIGRAIVRGEELA